MLLCLAARRRSRRPAAPCAAAAPLQLPSVPQLGAPHVQQSLTLLTSLVAVCHDRVEPVAILRFAAKKNPCAGAWALADALAGAAGDSAQSVRVQAAWGLANLADALRQAATSEDGQSTDCLALPPSAAACLPVLCTGVTSSLA